MAESASGESLAAEDVAAPEGSEPTMAMEPQSPLAEEQLSPSSVRRARGTNMAEGAEAKRKADY